MVTKVRTTQRLPVSEGLLLTEAMECQTDRSLATTPLAEEPAFAFWQQDIPAEYWALDAQELVQRIHAAKAELAPRLVILGHHYQREDIIQFADYRGDSLKLAQWAAEQHDKEYIVFCGVHFMAEAADILSGPNQVVMLPNMAAGCSMADMAAADDVYACWDELQDAGITDIVPVTYINSAASLKAHCGRYDGIICTSSNARMVLKWGLEHGRRALFFPDQHLGRNTAVKLGIPLEEMAIWDYTLPPGSLGGNTIEQLQRARVILWKGHCSVHARFSVEQIERAREEYPGIKVIVHPECRLEVVQAADGRRLHRVHRPHRRRGAGGQPLGGGHGDQPRVAPGPREPGQAGVLPGPRGLPLLYHVPHPPGLPVLGAGASAGGPHREPGDGGRRDGRLRQGGPRPDAGGGLATTLLSFRATSVIPSAARNLGRG